MTSPPCSPPPRSRPSPLASGGGPDTDSGAPPRLGAVPAGRRLALALTLIPILAVACGGDAGDPTTPPGGDTTPAAVAAQGLAGFGGTVGAALSTPARVRVTASDGTPLAGVTVRWEVSSGAGSVSPVQGGVTDAAGVGSATWTLGTVAGTQELRASVGSLSPVVFTADARADLPAVLELADVPGPRVAWAGGPFADEVGVRVRDRFGNPVSNHPLSVEALEGVGWVPETAPRTDAEGRVSFPWYAAPDPEGGVQRLRISAGAGAGGQPGAEDVVVEGTALALEPGTTLTAHRDFVEYTPGTLPLILTAAHGGTLLPADLAERSGPGIVTVRDLDTDTLALLVADSLEALTGARPHLVRVHLHRRKLDANRALGEAALGDPGAVRAWHEFHLWTEAAMESVRRSHPRGVYVDVHGHGHEIQRLELGYLLTGAELASPDELLDQDPLASKSSLGALAAWLGATPSEAIRGAASLGARFHAQGYPAVPSPQDPHPAGAPYFSGGYNTRRYGCGETGSGNPPEVGAGTICGFQLEANRIGVRDSPEALGRFAGASARVLLSLLEDIGALPGPPAPPPAPAPPHEARGHTP